MSKQGPIILIEDDHDDKDIFVHVIQDLELKNELKHFDNCGLAMAYLTATSDRPFIIFCDINLPGMNGLDFKKSIDEDPGLRKKSIPFIFYSTSASQQAVNRAYLEMTIQGYFEKGTSVHEIRKIIKLILEYWLICKHPNSM